MPRLLPGLAVAWSTVSAEEAVRRCLEPQWRPALFITDVELDGTTGIQVARRIRRASGTVPIVAMSSFSPRKYAGQLADAGAQGFMVKGNMSQMAAALRAVTTQGTFSPVASIAFPSTEEACRLAQSAEPPAVEALSDIETRILQRTSEDFTTDQIAGSLNITPATVRSHTRNIREKLGAKTLSHAVAIWLMRGTDR